MKKVHYTDRYLLDPYHPMTIFVINASGTGSQVATSLARINVALQALEHPRLHVTIFDPDTVTEASIGRQLFNGPELELNKAAALVARINRFLGFSWRTKGQRYPLKAPADREGPTLANIIVTRTDNIRSRMNLWRSLRKHREHTSNNERSPMYWMDFGNARTTEQILIGNIRGRILQPVSNGCLPVPYMNVITEEVRYPTIKEKDSGPSRSLAEALQKQDLFINSILAQTGCDILWHMLREGRAFYRGAYLSLDTLRINPIPI